MIFSYEYFSSFTQRNNWQLKVKSILDLSEVPEILTLSDYESN